MRVEHRSESTEWGTPQPLFDALHAEFGFTLDPAATRRNAKCPKFFTKRQDGLAQDWRGERVFCNPPYARNVTGRWVEKCARGGADLVVALLPARTDTRWFHEFVLGRAEIRFLKGRLKFGGAKHGAPFPSLIAVWGRAP